MIRVFEMFAGFGGASFALKKARIQYKCIGYSEIDKTAIKIFELNHPNIENYGDCKKIDPLELPDFDLLTAGFPCQPFSVNTRRDVRGKTHTGYNLFKDIIRIIQIKKPKYILLENVKGILGEKSKEVYNSILQQLHEQGYDVRTKLINSLDYGIPQNRERVFFVCKLGHLSDNEFDFPNKEELKMDIKDILEHNLLRRNPKIMNYKLNKSINLKKYGDISRFDALLKSRVDKPNSNVLFEILDAPSNEVSRQSDRIYDSKYSPCITATGEDYLFYINDKVIVLSPKECFRLMGFLQDEIKLGDLTDSQKHKLAGNGWDINLVSKIFKRLFK